MPQTPRNTISFHLPQTGIFRDIVLGIYNYADKEHSLRVAAAFLEWTKPEFLDLSGIDGLIGIAQVRMKNKEKFPPSFPFINVSSKLPTEIPTVSANNYEIGQMAAEHLLSCGFATFASLGRPPFSYSIDRTEGFIKTINYFGAPCFSLNVDPNVYPSVEPEEEPAAIDRLEVILANWIKSLPKPVGIFAHDDTLAKHVAKVCEEQSWRVPADVGILGCDNDPIICCECYPQISSIIYPGFAVGMQAAALLDKWIQGFQPEPGFKINIPPQGVQIRGSTDLPMQNDDKLREAVIYLRNNIQKEISVEDLATVSGMSRRSFERRFRLAYWMSPLELIRNERIRKVKMLLAQVELPMSSIAELSGFLSAQRMATVFKQTTQQTPSQFRKHFQF